MVFLVPTVVGSALPAAFAVPAAYGDLLAALLALLAIAALRMEWSSAIALVWLFNVVGTLDLINGFYQGLRNNVLLGAAYYVPTFAVPALFVTHAMIFAMLTRRARLGAARSDCLRRRACEILGACAAPAPFSARPAAFTSYTTASLT